MRLLVSGSTTTIRDTLERYPAYAREHLGHLLTPHNRNKIETLLATGLPIACDNACFGGLDLPALTRMLERAQPFARRILWCTVPDVVADHRATLRLYGRYADLIGWAGIQRAFVAQDGCESIAGVPWSDIRCLFIGGSTAWKLSEASARLIAEAQHRGKWVHVGRVNTFKRIDRVEALDVDSIDGSQFSMFGKRYIPGYVVRLAHKQELLAQ